MKHVVYGKKAHVKMRTLPKNLNVRIRKKVDEYAFDTVANRHMVKRIVSTNKYRLRVGDWRILFEEFDDTIFVSAIEPRGSVYKR